MFNSDTESKPLLMTPPLLQLSTMFRRALWQYKAFLLLLFLSYIRFFLTASESCSMNEMKNSAMYDAFGFHDIVVGDSGSNYVAQSVCTDSRSFCFLSPLLGVPSPEHELKPAALGISESQSDTLLALGSANNLNTSWSNRNWSSDHGMFELLDGRQVSCSLKIGGVPLSFSSQDGSVSENPRVATSDSCSVSSSLSVEISPPVLDWGEKVLFVPSAAFLTVTNKCNNSVVHVYQPFSTDKQFYPCNSSEVSLLPGEAASICFMFLPRWLGLSSARLILQTNRGGFIVRAEGFVVESPYGIQSLVSIHVSSNLLSTKNFSLLNPLDEALYVEEITAWISFSSGIGSDHVEVACSVENRDLHEIPLLGMKDQFVVKTSSRARSLSVTVRPHNCWEIGRKNRQTVMEVDFLNNSQEKISGAFCMRLHRYSKEHSDTIMVPFEVDLDKKAVRDDSLHPVSLSLEPLVPYDGATEMVVSISLKNNAPHVLTLIDISKAAKTKLFRIKYSEGLLLFPGTVTQVGLVTCAHLPPEHLDLSDIDKSCIMLVLTNDSSSPQVEILCRDLLHICSKNLKESTDSGNKRAGSSQFKAFEGSELDELVLPNWKSQASTSGISILNEHEAFFPIAEVGTHQSNLITVNNPSQQPIVVQLILNSGAVIDECKGQDGLFYIPSSSSLVQGESMGLKKHGFRIAENAVTEAYVHPNSEASLGPIDFHPSDRCRWRSSALIRNNLSGVEWISLKGFGGSTSLILVEGSKPLQSLEFYPNLSIPLNMSSFDGFIRIGETASTCSRPLSKGLYAKNTGDLPLEVKRITVSGKQCGSDGFMVYQCKGFSLEPGESVKLQVSYQTDFLASVVHKDLELAFAAGVLVIPMKASIPILMLNLCNKTVFWVQLKKLSLAVILAAVLMCLVVLYCVFSQVLAVGTSDQYFKNKRSCSCVHSSHEKGKVSISAEMDCLLRSIREKARGRYAYAQDKASRNDSSKGSTKKGKALASMLQKSIVVENSEPTEPEPANLTVKTGKDKKKRRKKKKGVVAGLTGLVGNSLSGNSTPTSPTSPVMPATPGLAFQQSPEQVQSQQTGKPFARVASAYKPSLDQKPNVPFIINLHVSPQQQIAKPILSHSATFPSAGNRCVSRVRSCSPLAPHARAPGSKLCNQKPGKVEKKKWNGRTDYTYDIWGDHLSGLQLMDRFKDVNCPSNSSFAEDESESFFLKGPQTLVANSQLRYASIFDQEG